MGGFGSGRARGKSVTTDLLSLDIRRLARAGHLVPGQSFCWQWSLNGERAANITMHSAIDLVSLQYGVQDRDGELQVLNYPVRVSWTPNAYGGRRAWWHCPAIGCGRRVAILYGSSIFKCRHCCRLAYRTQREGTYGRACIQAEKLRLKLQWELGTLNLKGGKPMGMHWRTFRRLESKHDVLTKKMLRVMHAKLEGIRERGLQEPIRSCA
jgi:hypothetical protein